MLDPFVRGMMLTRCVSAAIELTAALLMWRLNRVEAALQINGMLGLVGPLILAVTTAIGLAGLAESSSPWRLLMVGAGAVLILLGTR